VPKRGGEVSYYPMTLPSSIAGSPGNVFRFYQKNPSCFVEPSCLHYRYTPSILPTTSLNSTPRHSNIEIFCFPWNSKISIFLEFENKNKSSSIGIIGCLRTTPLWIETRMGQKCTILEMKFSSPTRWSQNRRYERT